MNAWVRILKDSKPLKIHHATLAFAFVTAFVVGAALMVLVGMHPATIKPAKIFFGLVSAGAWLFSTFNPMEIDPTSQISREATRRLNVLAASFACFYILLDAWAG
jgi:glucan phosphoethanolaminetransferase (alkaline phosphatase superfamily)